MQTIINIFKSTLAPLVSREGAKLNNNMTINKITDEFYVTGQIGFADLPKLADMGIKSIICARPDDEEGNQPLFADIAKEAEKLGIFSMHVPIAPGQACKADVDKFAQGYADMPKPILGYCRSGARAHSLWELNQEATAMHVPIGE